MKLNIKKILLPLTLFIITMFFSFNSHADLTSVVKNYNLNMMGAIGDAFLNNDALKWNGGGLVRLLFEICFLISFTNALRAIGNDMLMKFFDLGFYSVIAMALLGQPDAYRAFAPMFAINPSGAEAKSYKYGGAKSLDRDIYMWLSYSMDRLADNSFGADVSDKLYKSSETAGFFVGNVISAQRYCKMGTEGYQSCALQYMRSDGEYFSPEVIAAKKKADEDLNSFNPIDVISAKLAKLSDFFAALGNPFSWFFPFLLWLFDLIRSAVNLFLLIGFGIMTAFSLFMAKLFVPFLLLPSQRQTIIKALKVPLSATMWGFVTSLIIFMSYEVTKNMTSAGLTSMTTEIKNSGGISSSLLIGIMTSMFLTQLVIAAIQIVALFKVPKIAENILNFSLAPVVGIGGELISASAGIMKMIGSVAMPVAGAAMSAASAAGGAAKSAAGGAVKGAIGAEGMSKIRSTASSLTGGRIGGGGGASSGSGSGMGPIGASGVAAKESVKDSYADFQNSKGGNEAPKPSKLKAGLGGLMNAGKKVAGEMGGMALDATTGNYSGMESRLSTNMENAGKSVVGGVNAVSGALNSNKDAIESRVRGATSKAFSGFHSASKEDKNKAQSNIMGQMVTKELAGDDAKQFSAYEAKVNNNEALTSEDMAFAGNMQNTNLDQAQKATVAEGLKRQYDEAAQNSDYESMMKISNNSLSGASVQARNSTNLKNMPEYMAAVKATEARVAKLAEAAIGNKNNQNSKNTIEAQNQLSELVNSGIAKKSVLTTANSSGASLYGNVTNKYKQETMSEMDSLVNKDTNRTSVEDLTLKNLAEDHKHYVTDPAEQQKIIDSLTRTGHSADFSATSMNQSSANSANATSTQVTNGSFKTNGNTFNFNQGQFQSATFTDRNNKVHPISEVKSGDMKLLRDELDIYDTYLQEFNAAVKKDPSYKGNRIDLQRVKTSHQALSKMISEIEEAKKK